MFCDYSNRLLMVGYFGAAPFVMIFETPYSSAASTCLGPGIEQRVIPPYKCIASYHLVGLIT